MKDEDFDKYLYKIDTLFTEWVDEHNELMDMSIKEMLEECFFTLIYMGTK